jgi:hypothetical protein
MDENYDTRLNELTRQVNSITNNNVNNSNTFFSNISNSIKSNYLYIYVGIPIIIFIILIILKPKFIMKEIKDEKTFFIDNKINYSVVFIIIFVILIIETVYYFINNINKKS